MNDDLLAGTTQCQNSHEVAGRTRPVALNDALAALMQEQRRRCA